MKPFERAYLLLETLLPPLHHRMRRDLLRLAGKAGGTPEILDVGGRKSHCTIGVPGWITISDLPRRTEMQERLNLGVTPSMSGLLLRNRSNIRAVVLDDMTRSELPDNSFDCVLAIEVLEHVEEDDRFVAHAHRVLRPGGWFLMSTPNGDFLRNRNPDHKRHYTRAQLTALLAKRFAEVEVEYAIAGGGYRKLGLHAWSPRRPLRTVMSMLGNVINRAQSTDARLRDQARGTHHLIARARKRDD
ncbi:MAG: class I SAM-dependent methyltransferase [Blastocatellia bacterium]